MRGNTMTPDVEAQIAELQTRLAFQEDTLNSLNDVISKQDTEICSLSEQVRALYRKIDDMTYDMEGTGNTNNQERPPHY